MFYHGIESMFIKRFGSVLILFQASKNEDDEKSKKTAKGSKKKGKNEKKEVDMDDLKKELEIVSKHSH